jgi:arylsulfatase
MFFAVASVGWAPVAADAQSGERLTYREGEKFPGKIGRSPEKSTPAWPERSVAPEGAPNVLIWLLDDAGFAHLSPYGGVIDTPTIEGIAEDGVVFSNFHSVPLCSPARAALLAGRNHHSIGMGSHVMSPAGFPGYNSRIPKSAGSLARVLKDNGYATFALGKWDQTPVVEAGPAGPFDSWPSGQGFDHFYGFVGGEAHHFSPSLWSDHTAISPHEGNPGYFLTTDLADQAIDYLSNLRATRPGTPFFMYWATGAVHAPHHAPQDYIDAYRGRFDGGWDATRAAILDQQKERGIAPESARLSPRPDVIPGWDTLPFEERALYARQMEAFAAQLTHADEQFGRLLDYLESTGSLENTIVIVTSDNGSSAEGGMYGLHNEALSLNSQTSTFEANNKFLNEWGGPRTANHFHAGWGMAGNTPFPYFKHHSDEGGTRVPMLLSWPAGMAERGVRAQYHHMIDVMPTVLALAGVQPAESIDGIMQQPLDGVDMTYAVRNEDAEDVRVRQYFEIWGNRAIYDDGWLAVTIHNEIMPWQVPIPGKVEDDVWRLYNLRDDFSASTDLAEDLPEKLEQLKKSWDSEAEKYGVFPLDPNRRARFIAAMNKSGPRGSLLRYPGQGVYRVPEALSPPVKNRSYEIRVRLDSFDPDADSGVLVAAGGKTGGYTLYIDNGYVYYEYNLYNEEFFVARSNARLSAGDQAIRLTFDKDNVGNGGLTRLFFGDSKVGEVMLSETVRNSFSIEDGFDIGRDSGSSVSRNYKPPYRYSGQIADVEFELGERVP